MGVGPGMTGWRSRTGPQAARLDRLALKLCDRFPSPWHWSARQVDCPQVGEPRYFSERPTCTLYIILVPRAHTQAMSSAEPIPLQSLGPTPLRTPALSLDLSEADLAAIRPSSRSIGRTLSTRSTREGSSPEDGHADDQMPTQFIAALPPVDGGRDAWSFLVAATILETLIWGVPYTVGIFHEYWTSTTFKGQGEGIITLAATLQTGLMYMSTAVFGL